MTWLVVTLLLLLARTPGWPGLTIWTVLFAPVPLQLIREESLVSGKDLPLKLIIIIIALTMAAFIAAAVWWRRNLFQKAEHARRIAVIIFGFVAITSLATLGQLLWTGWKARDLNAALPLHQFQATATPKPRIVWIVFDELSYQQVYERRYPGLQLPAFDQLAGQATLFTNTVPTGTQTQNVIPALFTGWPVDDIKSSGDARELSLHSPGSKTWRRFDPRQTVFADALTAGYSTAIAGWYNPYCSIMPEVLDQCFWTFNTHIFGAMSPSLSPAENVWASLVRKARFLQHIIDRLRKDPLLDPDDARAHQLDYVQISAAADRLLQSPSASFIFLHMPVPHPDGIYDRRIGQFATANSSYIDNLALADRYLAHVRSLLEQNGSWDSSTIVVMGDHSWRTFVWKTNPQWTPEEQLASNGGQYDPRPVYIVKLPYQHQPARIDLPYAAIHTRALLDALIADQIHSPAALSTWAAQWPESTGSRTTH